MAKNEEKPGALHGFLGGLILTIILVVVVPIVTALLIQPFVENMFAEHNYNVLMSATVVTIVMLVVLILFILLLGGGKILRKYGIFGVIGLIAAYWYLGDVWGAALPIAVIIIFAVFGGRKKK